MYFKVKSCDQLDLLVPLTFNVMKVFFDGGIIDHGFIQDLLYCFS